MSSKLPRPEIAVRSFITAAPFYQAKEVCYAARGLLAFASNFRMNGANLYRLCCNEGIERMLGLSHGQYMRAKKQLQDAGLLDYDGNPGNYDHLIHRWEKISGEKWGFEL